MASQRPPDLEELRSLNSSSADFERELQEVLYQQEYATHAEALESADLVWLVDYLDKTIHCLEPSGGASRKCLRELRDICGSKGILPTSYSPPPHGLNISPDQFAEGGIGVVHKATFQNRIFCVKRIKVQEKYGVQEARKILCKEAVMWKSLNHANILSLLWATLDPLQLISDWMPGGELPQYIKNRPDTSRLELLSDVAKGLGYLHSRNMLHGDLKGSNVLVDDSGRARISDFGFTTVTQNPHSKAPVSCHQSTLRYCAPEVLKGEGCSPRTDIYSFGMIMFEAFAGKIPFSGKGDYEIFGLLYNGERPPRPDHSAFTYRLWKLMQNCWDNDPGLRPEASKADEIILKVLNSGPDTLEQFRDLDTSSPNFEDQLGVVLYGEQYAQSVQTLNNEDAISLVDYLDNALDHLGRSSATYRKCLRELGSVCGDKWILPTSYASLPHDLEMDNAPFAYGSYANVYRAEIGGLPVCVKRLRVYRGQNLFRPLCKEAVTWKHLSHPNIVTPQWITFDPLQIISNWMSGGNLREHVEKHPDVNRVARLLSDVVNGLSLR